ncbi:MAG: ATP-dependent RNA helicase RhlB, partial [Pseudomonadota bacterium]
MKKKLPKGNKSTAKPKSGSLRPDRESRSFHRLSPWKKVKKNRRSEDAPAASVDSAMDDRWNISQFKVPPIEGSVRFHDFDLPNPLLHAIFDLGFKYCTPIQAEILPSTLSGKDASG